MSNRGERTPNNASPLGPMVVGCGALGVGALVLAVAAGWLVMRRSEPPVVTPPIVMAPTTPPVVSPLPVAPLPVAPMPPMPPPPPPMPATTVSDDVVSRVLRAHQHDVTHCVDEHAATGRLVVHLTVAADGTVSDATADGIDDAALTSCIADHARRWIFPASETPLTADVPIVLGSS